MRRASAASQMSPLPSTGMSTWSTSAPMASQSASLVTPLLLPDTPLDEPDEWGDLASFREAAARS